MPTLQGCRYECPQGGHQRGLTVAPLLKTLWSASTLASGAISAHKAPVSGLICNEEHD